MDLNLFDEKFIVFEIDKIKDDPVLFPIVVLIIMDVFLQKMRIKKGRKALIIEEAWKAISSPTMAEYIKYLYKTVRKFHGIAGVVTQELGDVIDSPPSSVSPTYSDSRFLLSIRSITMRDATTLKKSGYAVVKAQMSMVWKNRRSAIWPILLNVQRRRP